MKFKRVIAVFLGLFVAASAGTLIYKHVTGSMKVQVDISSTSKQQQKIAERLKKRIDATYFHGSVRCYTCNLMENYIKETLNESFSEQLKSGQLNFQIINIEEAGNRHYVQDYKLYTKAFILSLKDQDKEKSWLNCEKIWKLVRDKDRFKKYIKTEVENYLGMI